MNNQDIPIIGQNEDAPEKPVVPPFRSFRIKLSSDVQEVIDAHSITIDSGVIMFFVVGPNGMKYCKYAFNATAWQTYEELTTTALTGAIN